MSGHSRWATIKHKKGAIDAKRGKIFSKIIREITVAARLGGPSADGNVRLRAAIQKAKANNLPAKNIESAINKGAGVGGTENYEEIVYEGYGPSGVGLMIRCLTDNKNRTVSDLRSVLTKNGGNLGESGAVAWQFEKKGVISIEREKMPDEDKMMEAAIEAGADDVKVEAEGYTILTAPDQLAAVQEKLKEKKLEAAESDLIWYPKNTIPVDSETADKVANLSEQIDDLDDVQAVSSNEEVSG